MSLDDDLAAWAATVRLRDSEAAAIFDQIVATPVPVTAPALDPSWWRDYTAAFTARMIASTRWTPAARPARRAA